MGEAAIYMMVINNSHVRCKAPPCKHGREYSEQAGQAGMQGRQDREHSEIREYRAPRPCYSRMPPNGLRKHCYTLGGSISRSPGPPPEGSKILEKAAMLATNYKLQTGD